ncbi:MAG TPA: hypothetical protein VMG41_01905 [Gemmatimonadales bacterium]|nr:hypothetical protein [Gemmatimonadales bacterium]
MLKPPIVIDTRGGLLVFASQSAAERELAVEDVRAGAYPVAYDIEGRLLRIEVQTRERRILGVFRDVRESVRIVAYEHIATHDRALHDLLARFIGPVPAIMPPSQKAGR